MTIITNCPWWYDNAAMSWKYRCENSTMILTRVHAPDVCQGQVCPVHMPTEHSFRTLPQTFQGGVMYRVNPKGKMIVDPDDPAAQVRPWKRRGRAQKGEFTPVARHASASA